MRTFAAAIAFSVLTALAGPGETVRAAATDLINYQGILRDAGGTPLSGTFAVTFAIWPTPTGGSPIWSEATSITTGTDGLFNVLLGSVNPLDELVFTGEDTWLGVAVESDTEMPRQRLTSVPYSHRTGTIDGASGGVITGQIEATGSDNKIRFLYQNYSDLPAPGAYHGMFAHVHATDGAYFAHSGGWNRLADSAHTHNASGIVDEAGVAASISQFVTLPVGLSTIRSQTIAAPGPGFVIALATVEVTINHAVGTSDEVHIDIQDNNLAIQDDISVLIPGTVPTGNHIQGVAVHQVFSVNAGNSTFYLLGEKTSGGTADVKAQGLTLIYVPTAYGSTPGASSANAIEAQPEVSSKTRLDQLSAQMTLIQREIEVLRGKAE